LGDPLAIEMSNVLCSQERGTGRGRTQVILHNEMQPRHQEKGGKRTQEGGNGRSQPSRITLQRTKIRPMEPRHLPWGEEEIQPVKTNGKEANRTSKDGLGGYVKEIQNQVGKKNSKKPAKRRTAGRTARPRFGHTFWEQQTGRGEGRVKFNRG